MIRLAGLLPHEMAGQQARDEGERDGHQDEQRPGEDDERREHDVVRGAVRDVSAADRGGLDADRGDRRVVEGRARRQLRRPFDAASVVSASYAAA